MQLGRLCFVLPPDFDEDHDELPKPVSKQPKSHRRHCGGELFSTIRRSLHTLLATVTAESCFRHHSNTRQFSGMFHDTAGADLSEKVATGIGNPKIFSYAELYIGSKGFSEDELLGSGGFGRVYRAVLPSDGTVAAVKCLAEKGERFEKTFEAELAAVAHLRHRNLVRLRGWCVHEDQLLLVYDFMPNRSLDRILFRRSEMQAGSPAVLTWKRRDNIVKGLAGALFYLHEQLETQIIHRDVKASNVMLDSHYNARLGDFGLARWLEHDLVYQNPPSSNSLKKHQRFHLSETTRIGGTIGYLPPESFQKKSTATAKSDVFSFGIVLMEVVSGRRALDLSFSDDQIILLDWIRRLSDQDRLLQAVDNRIEDGSYRLSDMERFLHVGLLCTLQNPFSRPNMKWVIEAISGKMYGKLPVVPSFRSQPLYISLSSSSSSDSSSGTSTTVTKSSVNSIPTANSTHFLTANRESTTIYLTAENGVSSSTEHSFRQQPSPFMIVDTPNEIPFSKLVTATNNFSDSNLVAEIDFGTAYHGFLSENKQHVLVKRLGMKTCPALRQRFSNELQNLTRLRHRNLVHLRGWCTEHGEMLIVYDYSAKRLLSNILFHRDKGHSPLRWHHRYNIVRSLASAIRYLHEEWDEQVIHKSITTSAIVLDPDMNPRLSSFALAEFLTRKELGNGNHHVVLDTKRSVRGIFGYMSPEYMRSGEATPMADIYSFGVVLLELVTGQSAVDFRRPDVLLVGRMRTLVDMQKEFSEDLVDMRLNGVYDHVELSRLVKLGIACTRSDAKSRPTVGQMLSILDGNDDCLMEIVGLKRESRAEWRQENDCALRLVRRIQSLGIQ